MSRFVKAVRRPDVPTRAEMRRQQERWLDLFHDAVIAQVNDSSAGQRNAADVVHFAGELATLGLEEIEKRWTKL